MNLAFLDSRSLTNCLQRNTMNFIEIRSSVRGNLFGMAGVFLFLPFWPPLPKGILLTIQSFQRT